jgi:hypothetical protein
LLLHHGTTSRYLKSILRHGLRPRGSKRSTFRHFVESCREVVYLTDYASIFYAMNATGPSSRWCIVEVETDRLDAAPFVPDEDYLTCARFPDRKMSDDEYKWWLEYHRDRLREYSQYWRDSLKENGTCGYYGTVPPEAITRVALFDPHSCPWLGALAHGAVPVLADTDWKREKFTPVTRFVFGDVSRSHEVDVLAPFPSLADVDQPDPELRRMLERFRRHHERLQLQLDEARREVIDLHPRSP